MKIDVFFSYSHRDEALRDELAAHLRVLERQGVIRGWHDRRIGAGEEWKVAIDDYLEMARVILLLVSSDFLASDYCYDVEMSRALARHDARDAVVIPVILRDCAWDTAPFGKLQPLPRDGKAVINWSSRDTAWKDVVRGIRTAVVQIARGGENDLWGRFVFPNLESTKADGTPRSLLIVAGAGKNTPTSSPKVFPSSGGVEIAQAGIVALAARMGCVPENIHTLHADRDLSQFDLHADFVFSIASPAVNSYTNTLMAEWSQRWLNYDTCSFMTEDYPQKPVRLSVPRQSLRCKTLAELQDPTAEVTADDRIILTPTVSADKMDGVDYGLIVRVVKNGGLNAHVQFVVAGCRNYGTWAAYAFLCQRHELTEIAREMRLQCKDLERVSMIWIVVQGRGEHGRLNPNTLRVVACRTYLHGTPGEGVVVQPPPKNPIVGMKVRRLEQTLMNYLWHGVAEVMHQYEDGSVGEPYRVSFVRKDGCDSVAVLPFLIREKRLYVGIIRMLKPVLFLRRELRLPRNEDRDHLYFDGIVAGAMEVAPAGKTEDVDERAAHELREEGGYQADPTRMIDLGSYFTSPGYAVEKMYLRAYQLDNVRQGELTGDGTQFEEGLRIRFLEVSKVLDMCLRGEIQDPKTELAIRRLCVKLGYIPELNTWRSAEP